MGRITGNSLSAGVTNEQKNGIERRAKGRGHMFLVDVPTFAKVCSLKDADVAAAYLILLAGTGADNRTSSWSREAINQRTALNWRKADTALAKLVEHGLARWLTPKGARKPRIDLPPIETRKPMQKHVATLAERIAHGDQPRTPTEKGAATIGRDLGWLACSVEGIWSFIADRPLVKAYLPMSLVGDTFGMATGETTIVDQIRTARDPMALQLLVDLYALQDLAEQGGVGRYWLEHQFTRGNTSTDTGSIRVWTFTASTLSARVQSGALEHHWRKPTADETEAGLNGAKDFFGRVKILEDAGALEWVYYLAEDATEGSTTIYPVGVKRKGKMAWSELESIIGGYAIRAACALGGYPGQAEEWESCASNKFILPADRMARQAAVVGIPRLRYRARTSNTSRWRQELVEMACAQKDVFRGIIAEKAPELLADADRRFADFNVEFNVEFNDVSMFVQRDINDPSSSGKNIPFLTERPPRDPVEDGAVGSAMRREMANWQQEADEHFKATGERY